MLHSILQDVNNSKYYHRCQLTRMNQTYQHVLKEKKKKQLNIPLRCPLSRCGMLAVILLTWKCPNPHSESFRNMPDIHSMCVGWIHVFPTEQCGLNTNHKAALGNREQQPRFAMQGHVMVPGGGCCMYEVTFQTSTHLKPQKSWKWLKWRI